MRRNKKVIGILAAALFAAAVCAVVLLYFGNKPKEVTSFNPQFEEDQTRRESESGASGGIKIPGYSEIVVDAQAAEVSVDLYNPEENKVYFQIEFYLPDSGETLYTSKLVKPGQHLYQITLERALEAGEYDLLIRYTTFSADDSLTPQNGAEVNCRLIAK